MDKYLKLMRVKHYVKNFFVFVPLFFSMSFLNVTLVKDSLIAFAQFCLTASAIYVINDIKDVEKDRKHPKKCKRPIASGDVSISSARIFALVLLAAAVVLGIVSELYMTLAMIAAYFVLNIAYTFKLKTVPLVDVFIIAIGFLLRIYAGAFAISVKVSEWLLLTALSLSLFLGFGKRYGEKLQSDARSRAVLDKYDTDELKSFVKITMTLTIVFYSLYCAVGSSILGEGGLLTVPIVMFAMFRYSMILDHDDIDGDPTDTLLKDRVVQLCVLLYGVIAIISVWR